MKKNKEEKIDFFYRFIDILSLDSKASEQVKFKKTSRNIGIFALLIILGNLIFELFYGISPDISTCVIIVLLIVLLVVGQKEIYRIKRKEKN